MKCNYCLYQDLKRRYPGRVKLTRDELGDWSGGKRAVIKPRKGEDEPRFVAWFAALPDHCTCDE